MKTLEAVLIKTSLVDYPERIAAACFLRGCNLRCPYCYNTELVAPINASQAQNTDIQKLSQDLNAKADEKALQAQDAGARQPNDQPQFVPIDDIIAHLKKRAGVLSGFVISGGEPLCQPELVRRLILEARSLGYKIKLDTNGMFPDRLQELLDDSAARPDYIALDVKTRAARYNELQAGRAGENLTQDQNAVADAKTSQDQNAGAAASTDFGLSRNSAQPQNAAAPFFAGQKILDSIKIVSALPADAREFRTVLYPPLVSRAEIQAIAALLPKDARWYFANFMNGHCLSAAAEKVAPYNDEETANIVELARATIPGAQLR